MRKMQRRVGDECAAGELVENGWEFPNAKGGFQVPDQRDAGGCDSFRGGGIRLVWIVC